VIIGLRPVRYFTEARLHGHMGICVLAARIVRPDKPELVLSARRTLHELSRIRLLHVDAARAARQVITRSSPFQSEILARVRRQRLEPALTAGLSYTLTVMW
jgi:hypothetical protein